MPKYQQIIKCRHRGINPYVLTQRSSRELAHIWLCFQDCGTGTEKITRYALRIGIKLVNAEQQQQQQQYQQNSKAPHA